MTSKRITIRSLQVATELADFLHHELLPRLGISQADFWSGFEAIINDLTPRNVKLLHVRDNLQAKIDDWHRKHHGEAFNANAYKQFLLDIGYLVEEGENFSINTSYVDAEIASLAGPQLVVPVKNARFALNAANARWGSLYDALYGTDVIDTKGGAERTADYNPARGARVIEFGREFLDQTCPLAASSHSAACGYQVHNGALVILLPNNQQTTLQRTEQFRGFRGDPLNPSAVLLCNNGLHCEIQIDRQGNIGSDDLAGIQDIVLEAALTTIQDCEDSVAAVDAKDKVEVYRNWLGLINGDLSVSFEKQDESVTRILNLDREYTSPDGKQLVLPGRSLMLVRNVGHLMRNSAIIDGNGNEIFEGIMDAMITAAIAALDAQERNLLRNSRQGSIYIVKPKMHGPAEVAFSCELFARVEIVLGIAANTIKIGIMDEERRTSINLKECIRQATERVVFINTGFLDRTGDEIHTCMEAGPVVPKNDMKFSDWIAAYERNNVAVGLACGLQGKAQIGKGMWAMPDLMARMLKEKIAHPEAGANTAWVPSPTAAALHALHYHQVDVFERQSQIDANNFSGLDAMLTLPLLQPDQIPDTETIQRELDNNAQGILGYVVRWINQGIGCSKVPDINNIALMEDRATLRISSQHMANWLHHGLCSEQQVRDTLERMAVVVDQQNALDPDYSPMAPDFRQSLAFQAACDLVFKALQQPNGYTEPILHKRRLEQKRKLRPDAAS